MAKNSDAPRPSVDEELRAQIQALHSRHGIGRILCVLSDVLATDTAIPAPDKERASIVKNLLNMGCALARLEDMQDSEEEEEGDEPTFVPPRGLFFIAPPTAVKSS